MTENNEVSIEKVAVSRLMSTAKPALWYHRLLGAPPRTTPGHYQWLPDRAIRHGIAVAVAGLRGRVLDAGCGWSPYRQFLPPGSVYVGADVLGSNRASVATDLAGPLPFRDGAFEGVLCTQVLGLMPDPGGTVQELHRCLRPGGTLILAAPHLYNEIGNLDRHRFTRSGLRDLLGNGFDLIDEQLQGGVGTALGLLLLNWLACARAAATSRPGRAMFSLFLALLPLVVNPVALVLDRLDRTNRFYTNVLLVARRSA